MKSFICRGSLNPVTSTDRISVDISASTNLELVDEFCLLGDMLCVDGVGDAAMEDGSWIQVGWNKFRRLNHCLPITAFTAVQAVV